MTGTFPLLIGSDFQLVAANVHAAPPSGPFLACIEEMNNARFTLAKTGCFGLGEKIGRALDDWRPEVGSLPRLKERLPLDLPVAPVQGRLQRILKQQRVHFGQERI